MALYSDEDLSVFKNSIEGIMKNIGDIVLNNYAPTKKEMTEIQKILLKYAKDNKRKMYGGFALHLAIVNKDAKGSFYKNEELYSKDLDLYSPEPLHDLITICDMLHEKGYTHIYAREAIHSETYTLEVNKHAYCDFSYVPKNIYNKIPFIQIDGYYITYPYFMEIDYLKMFIDPILSSYRWEKSFERFYLLQKYYPIKFSRNSLNIKSKLENVVYDELENFVTNNKSIALTGFYVYNIYQKVSKIDKKYIKNIRLPFFELVSIDYENDVKKILDILTKICDKDKIKINEYYPFFTFLNHRTEILYDDNVIVKIYKNIHNLCFSYVVYDKKYIGSFLYNLRMCLVNAIYERTNDNREMEDMYYDMASHLIQMRNYYFEVTDNNVFSKTLFQDFISECMGFTQNDKIDHDDMFKKKKRVVFKYTPNETKIDISKWYFSNTSGNKIHNSKNYQIHFENGEMDYHLVDEQ